VTALCRGIPGVRWLPPDHLHLTIRFIGEVDADRVAAIRETLSGAVVAPFVCRLQGVGRFPAKGRPRVIWVGVQAETGLMALAEMVEQRLRAIGILPEERPFFPHITLARLKEISPASVTGYLAGHDQFHSEPFTVHAYHLYSSLLTPKGAIHTRIQ
jgi:2'-5' RNA ligase